MQEEEAAAAAAALAATGGWVFPQHVVEDLPDPPPALALYVDNMALKNVYCAMAIMVNQVWRRRARDGVVRDRSSPRRETNAGSHEVKPSQLT